MSLVEKYPLLLDQDALEGPRMGRVRRLFGGYDAEAVARSLNQYAEMTSRFNINEVPASVIIYGRQEPQPASRRKDTAPANQPERIIATAQNMRAQAYSGPLVIAATVDYPDFQPTAAQMSQMADLGVRIIGENPKTNNPRAINRAFRELRQEEGVTVAIPSGSRFATDQALRAAARHIGGEESGVVAAYGPRVLDRNTTNRDGLSVLMGDSEYYEQYQEINREPSPIDNGFVSSAGAALCSMSLREFPLDEAYGRGGATRIWAARLQASDLEVVYDPTLAVHDHGNLGLDTLEEEATWLGPTGWPQ